MDRFITPLYDLYWCSYADFMLTIFPSLLYIFNILCPAISLKKGEINFLVNVHQKK